MFKRTTPITTEKWKFESYLGYNYSWWAYYAQYKNNIDYLINSIENDQNSIDTISLPLLFNIRHCIELGFKANILDFQKINSEISKINLVTHSLSKLFEKFKIHVNLALKKQIISKEYKKEILKQLEHIGSLTSFLSILDEKSFNFRYPFDTEDKLNFKFDTKINIIDIINLFNEIQSFFLFVYQGE